MVSAFYSVTNAVRLNCPRLTPNPVADLVQALQGSLDAKLSARCRARRSRHGVDLTIGLSLGTGLRRQVWRLTPTDAAVAAMVIDSNVADACVRQRAALLRSAVAEVIACGNRIQRQSAPDAGLVNRPAIRTATVEVH